MIAKPGVLPTLAAGLALAAGTPATAQDRTMSSVWLIQPTPAPEGERDLAGGEFVLKQRLLPTGLAELPASLSLGKETLPAGSQLIEVTTDGARVYCQPRIAKKKLLGHAQLCLVDSDSDGRFDGQFHTTSETKGLLTIGGNRPKSPKAIAPTAYAQVDPATMRDEYFVAIERRNFFNIYSLESFMIAFGRDGELDRITAPVNFKSTDMPKDVEILGARFTALSEVAGKMKIRVRAAMPKQPFGVVKTTSYSFY